MPRTRSRHLPKVFHYRVPREQRQNKFDFYSPSLQQASEKLFSLRSVIFANKLEKFSMWNVKGICNRKLYSRKICFYLSAEQSIRLRRASQREAPERTLLAGNLRGFPLLSLQSTNLKVNLKLMHKTSTQRVFCVLINYSHDASKQKQSFWLYLLETLARHDLKM